MNQRCTTQTHFTLMQAQFCRVFITDCEGKVHTHRVVTEYEFAYPLHDSDKLMAINQSLNVKFGEMIRTSELDRVRYMRFMTETGEQYHIHFDKVERLNPREVRLHNVIVQFLT